MNTQLLTIQRATTARRPQRGSRRVHAPAGSASFALRPATADDALAIHALIEAHLAEGRLLPRSLAELTVHASRFVVAVEQSSRRSSPPRIVGCAELAPLSQTVAEIRSLVVDRPARALGIGKRLIAELQQAASRGGFDRLCAFTHDAGYFVRKGFSIVPHHWVPEKIARDCHGCVQFRHCGQHAVVLPLKG
jgi:N-acetylglutamate synthase-like GNAT family acetyltransferase